MTKHMLEKLHSAYMAEVDKEACKLMMGFSTEEPYFVPRTMLQLQRPTARGPAAHTNPPTSPQNRAAPPPPVDFPPVVEQVSV
jgi:hypothetical protein